MQGYSEAQMQTTWKELLTTFGEDANDLYTYHRLVSNYKQPHRFYHDFDHPATMMAVLDTVPVKGLVKQFLQVGTFLHDGIQEQKPDDVERSAELVDICFPNAREGDKSIMKGLVLATDHLDKELTPIEKIMVDLDLYTLGADEAYFWKYEKNIRKEYSQYSNEDYRQGRIEILNMFLNKDTIYKTAFFLHKYEKQAEKNIKAAIAALEKA